MKGQQLEKNKRSFVNVSVNEGAAIRKKQTLFSCWPAVCSSLVTRSHDRGASPASGQAGWHSPSPAKWWASAACCAAASPSRAESPSAERTPFVARSPYAARSPYVGRSPYAVWSPCAGRSPCAWAVSCPGSRSSPASRHAWSSRCKQGAILTRFLERYLKNTF